MTDYTRDAHKAANELQRLLRQNRAHTYLHKQTKGKLLDLKNVSGIMTYATNIYKRQLINDQAEYELCLVLDLSGSIESSMRGKNPFNPTENICGINNSLYHAYLLSKVFTQVLGKKALQIYGFNRDWINLTELLLQHRYNATNTHKILSDIAELIQSWCNTSPLTLKEGVETPVGGCRAGGNHDGYYLLKSVEDMPWTVEEADHRIVIHFSDGQPLCHGGCGMSGCGRDGALRRDLHNSVKKLRESNYVCIGVGLGYNGVEEYYGDLSIVANNPLEMYTKTIDIVRKQMKRGNFR